jgi:hypothetical protein
MISKESLQKKIKQNNHKYNYLYWH